MKASAALVATALCLGVASAYAGPCTTAIAQFEQAVRQSAGNPDAGPMARQSIGAQLDRQPTPGLVKRAEERAQTAFTATLARQAARRPRGSRWMQTRARRGQAHVQSVVNIPEDHRCAGNS